MCSLAVLGSDFQKYMEAFKPFLAIGLKNYAEYQVGLAQLITTSCSTALMCRQVTQTSQC